MNLLRKQRNRTAAVRSRRTSWRWPVRPRWILQVALLPLEVAGLLALAVLIYGQVRYAPGYFTPAMAERYNGPAEAGRLLELALQTDDRALMAELQGLRWPDRLASDPNIQFAKLLERTDRYLVYLYVDMWTHERYLYYVEEVRGRWVVSPAGFYYYIRSGQWRQHFLILSLAWWLVGSLGLGFVWLLRTSDRFRAWLLGRDD